MMRALMETRKLSIGYRLEKGVKVLGENFNLNLDKGSFVALLGPNGSGKSTLIKTLSGLLQTLEGEVLIDGINLKKINKAQRARKISVVLTDPIYTQGLSVFDVVSLGRFPYTNWLGKLTDKDEAIIQESLELVDMHLFKHRKLLTLSDGEKQRVMIAKALAQQSEIVILDEPTAHLDLINRVEIMKLLQKLAHEQERAILISTHELDLAMQSADVLWLMREDKQISVGAPEDLILNNSMQEVFAKSSVDFDHLTGMFKIKHETKAEMHFQSDDAQIFLWSKKALEKIGVALVDNKTLKNSLIFESDSGLWKIQINGAEESFSSLAELVGYLKNLRE
ncbi:MAG: ABC transporter ATP-binding protein [Bacteroidetes bacterium]|nr:MAG: ABC transporter ATP-binding protein [Bacteroidota bacterium]